MTSTHRDLPPQLTSVHLPTGTPWLTRNQAAVYLQVHPATVDKYIADGVLPSHKFGGTRRFHRDELDETLRSGS